MESEIKSHHNPHFRLQLLCKAAKLVSRSTFGASGTPKQVKSFTALPDLFSSHLPYWHDSHTNFISIYSFSTVIGGEGLQTETYCRTVRITYEKLTTFSNEIILMRNVHCCNQERSQNCEKLLLASPYPSVHIKQLGSHWTDFHEI